MKLCDAWFVYSSLLNIISVSVKIIANTLQLIIWESDIVYLSLAHLSIFPCLFHHLHDLTPSALKNTNPFRVIHVLAEAWLNAYWPALPPREDESFSDYIHF